MRKVNLLITVIFIVTMMLGCSATQEIDVSVNEEIEVANPYENQKIGMVVSTLLNPFFVDLKDGATEQADTYNVELLVLDSRNDTKREQENIESLIKQNVDVILLNATDATAAVSLIEMAVSAGIPVATIDRNVQSDKISVHITSDNFAGGQLAGNFVAEQLAGKGTVVELLGISGVSVDDERGNGFRSIIDTSSIVVAGQKRANFDRLEGQNVMSEYLTTISEIDAVFAHNDEMALGALKAITLAERDIIVVGFDGADDAIIAIQDGSMAATVAQQPKELGREGIIAAVKLANDEEVDEEILVPLKLITRLIE